MSGKFNLALTQDELLLINNALNEVVNGVDFDEEEFEVRLGYNREAADKLLQLVNALSSIHLVSGFEELNLDSGVVFIGKGKRLLDVEQTLFEILKRNHDPLDELLVKELDRDKLYETSRKGIYSFVGMDSVSLDRNDVLSLIAEKRPLKLVTFISIDSLLELNSNVRDEILGNYSNFVVGEINDEEKEYLQKKGILGEQD